MYYEMPLCIGLHTSPPTVYAQNSILYIHTCVLGVTSMIPLVYTLTKESPEPGQAMHAVTYQCSGYKRRISLFTAHACKQHSLEAGV